MSLADESPWYRFLWYGDGGSGKTTSLAAGARMGKTHIVAADPGLYADPLRDLGIPPENIEPFRTVTYPALDGMFWDLKEALDEDPDAAVAVGFDSMTEVVATLLGQIVDKEQGAKIAKAKKAGQDSDDIDPFFRDLSYYGTMTEQLRRLTRSYRQLPVHVGFTALTRRDVDEKSGEVKYGPAVNPAYQNDLVGYVDLIAHNRVDGVWPEGYEAAGRAGLDVIVADLRKVDNYEGKDRFHQTPRTLVNPTMDRLVGYLRGELTTDNDEQMKAYRALFQDRKAEARREKELKAERRAALRSGGRRATKTAAASEGEGGGADSDDE